MTTTTTESWKCYCKLKTAKKRSKKANENFNREFHCCPKNKCRFFRWEPSVSSLTFSTTPTKRPHAKLPESSDLNLSSITTDSPLTKKRFFPPPKIQTNSVSLPKTDSKSLPMTSSSISASRFEKFDQMLTDPDSLLLRCSKFLSLLSQEISWTPWKYWCYKVGSEPRDAKEPWKTSFSSSEPAQ